MPHPGAKLATASWLIAYLAALVAVSTLSIGIYIPSMPDMVGIFGTTAGQVKLTLTVFLAGVAVAQLVHGPLSDRFGRRPVLIGGLALFVAASVLCALANSIETLILGRFLQAVGACSGQVISRAIARDLFEGPRMAKVMATVGLVLALGPALAPVVGGLVHQNFGWTGNFHVLTAVGALVLLFTAWKVTETNARLDADATNLGRMALNYATLCADPRFVGYILCLGFSFGTMFSYVGGSPFIIIDRLGYSPATFGALSMLNVIGYAVGTVLAQRLAGLGAERAVGIGSALTAVGGILMLAFPLAGVIALPSLVVPMIIMLCGMGIVIPNAMAGGLQGYPRIAGAASALMGCCQMGFGMGATLLVGWLDAYRPLAMFEVFFVLSMLGPVAWFTLLHRRRAPAATPAE